MNPWHELVILKLYYNRTRVEVCHLELKFFSETSIDQISSPHFFNVFLPALCYNCNKHYIYFNLLNDCFFISFPNFDPGSIFFSFSDFDYRLQSIISKRDICLRKRFDNFGNFDGSFRIFILERFTMQAGQTGLPPNWAISKGPSLTKFIYELRTQSMFRFLFFYGFYIFER